jgi:hypothetical protein
VTDCRPSVQKFRRPSLPTSVARGATGGYVVGPGFRTLASSWLTRVIPYAPVAQWIEHRPSKPRVAGSTPAGRANSLRELSAPSSVQARRGSRARRDRARPLPGAPSRFASCLRPPVFRHAAARGLAATGHDPCRARHLASRVVCAPQCSGSLRSREVSRATAGRPPRAPFATASHSSGRPPAQ